MFLTTLALAHGTEEVEVIIDPGTVARGMGILCYGTCNRAGYGSEVSLVGLDSKGVYNIINTTMLSQKLIVGSEQ